MTVFLPAAKTSNEALFEGRKQVHEFDAVLFAGGFEDVLVPS